jgi:formylmethanofuran dehydrogenase subunit C
LNERSDRSLTIRGNRNGIREEVKKVITSQTFSGEEKNVGQRILGAKLDFQEDLKSFKKSLGNRFASMPDFKA